MYVSSQTIGLILSLAVLAGGAVYVWSRWGDTTWIDRQKLRLGLDALPAGLFVALAAIWTALFVMLLFGLFYVPAFLAWQDFAESPEPASDLRWTLLALAAVTAALSAVVALPFTLLRTKFNREQTEHSEGRTRTEEEGLLTDRINKAVEGLGAQKEVNRLGRNVTFVVAEDMDGHLKHVVREFEWKDEPVTPPVGWTKREDGEWTNVALTEPNLEVRIGAIYSLERIARRNIAEVHVQIMEILCAYIRENAPAEVDDGPQDWLKQSENDGPMEEGWRERKRKYEAELANWLEGIAPRTDIGVALEVIGRRNADQRAVEARHGGSWTDGFVFDHPPNEPDSGGTIQSYREWVESCKSYQGYRLDLRRTDLRGADIPGVNLAAANLIEAQLQGAVLRNARMEGALLLWARLQGAVLVNARLAGAALSGARLEGATLTHAHLQCADFGAASLQGADLFGAQLREAMLRSALLHGADLQDAQLEGTVFSSARLQGANLRQGEMRGADLTDVLVDAFTDLKVTSVRGSALMSTDYAHCSVGSVFFEQSYGDGSVEGLPQGFAAGEAPLGHWHPAALTNQAFRKAWRAWQVEIGYRDPDDTA